MGEDQLRFCAICGRDKPLQFHHLIPKKLHKKREFALRYEKSYMHTHGIEVCADCHRQIHRLFDLHELGRYYNTLEKLLQTQQIRKYLRYIVKKK